MMHKMHGMRGQLLHEGRLVKVLTFETAELPLAFAPTWALECQNANTGMRVRRSRTRTKRMNAQA